MPIQTWPIRNYYYFFVLSALLRLLSYNMTPLLTAASIGFMDACELLVDAGADINYIPDG